ncbi:hypothetical protein PVAND_014031 [Polypedilum vanderplanki]|uniref:Uncharacterized protein n=1 Tax=Polypedilum vanderplanki TaxID=319348 RepID=A0A9J6CR56_POLVA|nr:hypothetical protein PVAND_014031 [Polypedilum vanderplanki]
MRIHEKPPDDDNHIFDNFDQPDDARSAIELIEIKKPVIAAAVENYDRATKDLLNRLLETNPQHRLKSIRTLQRIAFYHNFNFDEIRHRKISPRKLIEDDERMP